MARIAPCAVPLGAPSALRPPDPDGLTADDEAEDDVEVSNCEARASTPARGRRRLAAKQEDGASRLPPALEAEVKSLPNRRDVSVFAFIFFLSVTVGLNFLNNWLTQEGDMWRWGCQQCKKEWWREFWRWRLELVEHPNGTGLKQQPKPPGMDWNWGSSTNDTDWWAASAELVREVVLPHVDGSLGPLLQIGCGDSPLPALLYEAGFRTSEHIDIEPRVVEAMRKRYPEATWPGMRFEERDFLAGISAGGGPPPPLNRFAAVVDKAGIWDWLLEEKPSLLPRLLAAVSDALILAPQPGAYVIATKQSPSEFQNSLSGQSGFAVEATRALLSSTTLGASAWAYVLVPA